MLANTVAVVVCFFFFSYCLFQKLCKRQNSSHFSSSHAMWEHMSQTLFPHDHKNVCVMTFFEKIKRLVPWRVPGNGSMFAKISKGLLLLMSRSMGVWGSVYFTGVSCEISLVCVHSFHQASAGKLLVQGKKGGIRMNRPASRLVSAEGDIM